MTRRAGARPASGTLVVALVVALAGGCSGDTDATSSSITAGTTTSSTSTTTVVAPTGTSSSTTPGTTAGPATTTAATTTITATSTTSSTTTTTSTIVPTACDRAEAVSILDDTVALARLAPGGAWSDDTDGIAFDARTDTADAFGHLQGFDCALRVAQRTDAGAERLALIAWNQLRNSLVIQATDAPDPPYATDVRFQLFLEQPDGEWLVDQFVWAASMSGGESIVVGAHDTSVALAAKSWQAAIPPFEDLPVSLDIERYGIDTLVAAGGRLVSLAEPTPYGFQIASIQLHTPLALVAFAAVGPAEAFDPSVPIVADGETTWHVADGVRIRLTTGKELGLYELYEAGWRCAGHSWRLHSSYGSPTEVLDFAERIVATACG